VPAAAPHRGSIGSSGRWTAWVWSPAVATLGSILAGLATPTEAAGTGALGAVLLAPGYRALSWDRLRDATAGDVTGRRASWEATGRSGGRA
jgi:TRAP-type C4-dicarboxylate transport system permease large subunit